jgi:hypothetical protein
VGDFKDLGAGSARSLIRLAEPAGLLEDTRWGFARFGRETAFGFCNNLGVKRRLTLCLVLALRIPMKCWLLFVLRVHFPDFKLRFIFPFVVLIIQPSFFA